MHNLLFPNAAILKHIFSLCPDDDIKISAISNVYNNNKFRKHNIFHLLK